MGKSKFPNVREFNTFDEMETYQLGVIIGLSMDKDFKLWDIWDYKITEGDADNER